MHEPDPIEVFAQPLSQMGIRHLISGSVASSLYGEPRTTHDIDLIVFLRHDDIPKLAKAFPEPKFYLPPNEVIFAEMNRDRRGHFNIICPDDGLKADIYLAKGDKLHAWAFRHARKYTTGMVAVSLAPPEYVIIRKLEFYKEGGSEKHLRDIKAMLAVSGSEINHAELNDWVIRQGVEVEWKKVSIT